MFLGNAIVLVLAVICGWPVVRAGEYCRNSFLYCPYYCCDTLTCCSDCTRSINYQYGCYRTYIYVGPIIGGVVSSIIFISVVTFLICLCCGCVCSGRTGIQRRGRTLHTAGAVTVVSSNQSAYPAYPQSQVVYPQAVGGYPPPYPPGDVLAGGYPQSGSMPYVVRSAGDVPPPYNSAYIHDGAKY